jgi:hypothetical protein
VEWTGRESFDECLSERLAVSLDEEDVDEI